MSIQQTTKQLPTRGFRWHLGLYFSKPLKEQWKFPAALCHIEGCMEGSGRFPWWISHLKSLKTTPRRQRNLSETCHPPQHHSLNWNEAGTGDSTANSQVIQLEQASGPGAPLWSPQPFQASPTPGSLGWISFLAKARTQDPPARMALLVQSFPPCPTRTRVGSRTGTDSPQSTKSSEVPQSAQGPAGPNL